jgi:serine/threonine protein kinase
MGGVSAADRFVVEHSLGQGGMGSVHQAYDTARGTMVALKMLQRVDPTSLLRFKTEFRALANLSHRNLVQLYDLVQRGDDYLLSMELVDGPDFLGHVRSSGAVDISLEREGATESIDGPILDRESGTTRSATQPARHVGRLDERKLRGALRQLAEGLHALHASGQLHRDLKPANVLVFRADERLVICDFGLIVDSTLQRVRPRASMPAPSANASHTVSDEIAGTLAFMSPEQTAGLPLSPASDWYAVGTMLYQALTLRLPFDPRLSWADALRVRQEQTPDHPLTIAAEAPVDLANLAMALLRSDPEQRAGYAAIIATLEGQDPLATAGSPERDLLVGRERELRELYDALGSTRAGRPGAALVSGLSGMGKSAVVQRFLSECEQAGALVLRGRCYECEELPYKAFDPLMDALSGHLLTLEEEEVEPLLPPDIACLAELFPVLGRVRAIAGHGLVSSVADPFERKRRATTACRRLLSRIGQRRALVLYVDDLQWGDLDSGPLFADVIRGPEAPAMLLLFAFRAEDEAGCALIRALREEYLPSADVRPRELRVEALSPADAEQLASELLAGSLAADRAVPAVVAEACGSPFFIRELSSYVRTSGFGTGELKLETVLKARIDALPEHSRILLELVAAAGRPEPQALLNEASALGERAFAAGQILKAHSLVHSSGSLENARLEAYHDRIRESVYAQLSPERARDLHRVLALALEQFAERQAVECDAEALCDHWQRAGERARALDYAKIAAERAESSLAFLHAAKLYGKALELVDEPAQASALEAQSGKALMFAGRGVLAADAFFRAMQSASEADAQEYRRLAITQLLNAGSLDRAFAELRGAEDVLGLSFPGSNLKAVGMLLWRRLRTRLDEAHFAARSPSRAPRAISSRLDNLAKISTTLSSVDFLRGGVYTAEHTLRAIQHGHPYHLAAALSVESLRSAGFNKKPTQTDWIIRRGFELAIESGDPYTVAVANGTAGVARYLEGKFLDAMALTREAQRIHREQLHGTLAWDIAILIFFELRAASQVGRVGEIVARVPDVLRDAEARGDRYASTLFRISRMCWAWLGVDAPDAAQEQLELATRQWTQEPYQLVHYYTLQAAGEIALYQGRGAAVWERALREQRQARLVTKIQVPRVEMLYLKGRLALQVARTERDPRALREGRRCAAALSGESASWARLLGRLLAGCSLRREAPREAHALLAPLPAELEQHDMQLSAAVTRYRLGELAEDGTGEALVEQARAAIHALGVTNPEAFVEMLAPA